MRILILLIAIFSYNLYANPIFDFLDLVDTGSYRKAKLLIRQSENKFLLEDEFGDKVNISQNLLTLISKVKISKDNCDIYVNEMEEDKFPDGIEYIFEEFNKNCLENGLLGKYSKDVKKTYKYNKFLKVSLENYRNKYNKAKARWNVIEQQFQQLQIEKNKYFKTAKYSLDETCKSVKMVQRFNKLMGDEERAAKKSGVINKAKMHVWGKDLVYWTNSFMKYKKQYEGRSKQIFKNSDCN